VPLGIYRPPAAIQGCNLRGTEVSVPARREFVDRGCYSFCRSIVVILQQPIAEKLQRRMIQVGCVMSQNCSSVADLHQPVPDAEALTFKASDKVWYSFFEDGEGL
jgi:hypothetical protein